MSSALHRNCNETLQCSLGFGRLDTFVTVGVLTLVSPWGSSRTSCPRWGCSANRHPAINRDRCRDNREYAKSRLFRGGAIPQIEAIEVSHQALKQVRSHSVYYIVLLAVLASIFYILVWFISFSQHETQKNSLESGNTGRRNEKERIYLPTISLNVKIR